jgi:hypothetical protein
MAETPRNDPVIKPETLRAAIEQFGCEIVVGWFTDEKIRRLVAEMGDKGDTR